MSYSKASDKTLIRNPIYFSYLISLGILNTLIALNTLTVPRTLLFEVLSINIISYKLRPTIIRSKILNLSLMKPFIP